MQDTYIYTYFKQKPYLISIYKITILLTCALNGNFPPYI